MSRTSVKLTVLTSNLLQVKSLIKDFTDQVPTYNMIIDECPSGRNCHVTNIDFDYVPNAILNIESELKDYLIPYTKQWDASIDFPRGEEHLRFNDCNTPVLKTIGDVKDKFHVDFDALKECHQLGSDYVQQLIDTIERENFVMSWASQQDIMTEINENKRVATTC